jgi:hypothetical protein
MPPTIRITRDAPDVACTKPKKSSKALTLQGKLSELEETKLKTFTSQIWLNCVVHVNKAKNLAPTQRGREKGRQRGLC